MELFLPMGMQFIENVYPDLARRGTGEMAGLVLNGILAARIDREDDVADAIADWANDGQAVTRDLSPRS